MNFESPIIHYIINGAFILHGLESLKSLILGQAVVTYEENKTAKNLIC